jgi:hypothetical protein
MYKQYLAQKILHGPRLTWGVVNFAGMQTMSALRRHGRVECREPCRLKASPRPRARG